MLTRLDIELPGVSTYSLGIANSGIDTVARARAAITRLNNAISNVSDIRAAAGVTMNRIASIADDNAVQMINMSAANSRIEDADMALEITQLTKDQIMQQAMISLAADADRQLQTAVLDLIELHTE